MIPTFDYFYMTTTTCILTSCSAEFMHNGLQHSFKYGFVKKGVGMIRIDETINERGEFKEKPHATLNIPADLDLTQKNSTDNILIEMQSLYTDLTAYKYLSQEYKISVHNSDNALNKEYSAVFKTDNNVLFIGNETIPVHFKEDTLKTLCVNIDSYSIV